MSQSGRRLLPALANVRRVRVPVAGLCEPQRHHAQTREKCVEAEHVANTRPLPAGLQVEVVRLRVRAEDRQRCKTERLFPVMKPHT